MAKVSTEDRPTMTEIAVLDGPMGTELLRRGVPTPLPAWSASALRDHPDVVREIHRDYAAAGATIHTTNTFRTRRRTCPDDWADLARTAVRLAREALPESHRLAGSVAPLEDCYRPDLSPSPGVASREHGELIRILAGEGVDLLLCETYPHVGEAEIAVRTAVDTGLETWVAFTAGPDADLLTPDEMAEGAVRCVDRGARAVLVNCVPASAVLPFLVAVREALDRAGLPAATGAYANMGDPEDEMGFAASALSTEEYTGMGRTWVDAGATILGACCGATVEHVAALAKEHG